MVKFLRSVTPGGLLNRFDLSSLEYAVAGLFDRETLESLPAFLIIERFELISHTFSKTLFISSCSSLCFNSTI